METHCDIRHRMVHLFVKPNLHWRKISPILKIRQFSSPRAKTLDKSGAQQLRENWLKSLTSPFQNSSWLDDLQREAPELNKIDNGGLQETKAVWVVGIDPDVSGAVALLKEDDTSELSAQVFDSPNLQVPVGKRARKRLDVNAIVQLLRSFDAPYGTKAFIEQSIPYPQDGKLGWWGGGFSYGLWIGVLVASGFSVVPVSSTSWKNEFKLSGNGVTKDDSRKTASNLFPSLGSSLKRKKDHGRAEALLIAAYGKELKLKPTLIDENGIVV